MASNKPNLIAQMFARKAAAQAAATPSPSTPPGTDGGPSSEHTLSKGCPPPKAATETHKDDSAEVSDPKRARMSGEPDPPTVVPAGPAPPSSEAKQLYADLDVALCSTESRPVYFDIGKFVRAMSAKYMTATAWASFPVALALRIYHACDPDLFAAHNISQESMPKRSMPGAHARSFTLSWLAQYPWLAYSIPHDEVFCRTCVLFLSRAPSANPPNLSIALVGSGYTDWRNAQSRFKKHQDSEWHQAASMNFLEAGSPDEVAASSTLKTLWDNARTRAAMANRDYLAAIAKPLLHLCRQGVPLRGHRGESVAALNTTAERRYTSLSAQIPSLSETSKQSFSGTSSAASESAISTQSQVAKHHNPGNFGAELAFLAAEGYDSVLAQTLFNPDPAKRPTFSYTSPVIQGQLVSIFAGMIRKDLIDEIALAPCFAILADEATDVSNQPQLAFCVRFIDASYTIREEFLCFATPPPDMRGAEAISAAILSTAASCRLNMNKCCGQGYDGCSTMSGQHNGVAARIKRQYPLAHYFHCASHVLSLCVARAAQENVQLVATALDHIDKIFIFFKYSPQRTDFLKTCIKNMGELPGEAKASMQGQLKGFSPTRWMQRIECLEDFVKFYPGIVSSLHNMAFGSSAWNTKTRSEASVWYKSITTFNFVYPLVVLCDLLSLLRPISAGLQKASLDIITAYALIEDCIEIFRAMRADGDARTQKLYLKSCALIAAVSGEPAEIPRRRVLFASGDTSNPSDGDGTSLQPSDYFRITVAHPVIDVFLQEMTSRFDPVNRKLVKYLYIIPAQMVRLSADRFSEICSELVDAASDLSPDVNQRSLEGELRLWFSHWSGIARRGPIDSVPDGMPSLLKAMRDPSLDRPTSFPNLWSVIAVLATWPVTTCTCERSISQLRRLKTYLRSTIKQRRLSDLSLIHANHSFKIDMNKALSYFVSMKNRRVSFTAPGVRNSYQNVTLSDIDFSAVPCNNVPVSDDEDDEESDDATV
jgi:hypothetical protein